MNIKISAAFSREFLYFITEQHVCHLQLLPSLVELRILWKVFHLKDACDLPGASPIFSNQEAEISLNNTLLGKGVVKRREALRGFQGAGAKNAR